MSNEFKIIFEDDEWIEFELVQPNNKIGDVKFWTDEDWTYWNEKMHKLEQEGTKGELETIRVKLKKNPFIDGRSIIGTSTETSGSEIQPGQTEV